MVSEVQFRINKLLDDARLTVTTSPQQIYDMYNLDPDFRRQLKTVTLVNIDSENIYYGTDATVSTANAGGVIRVNEKIEMPIIDLNWSPYFIAGASLTLAVTFWA